LGHYSQDKSKPQILPSKKLDLILEL
jgi:hypothetical protein